MAVGMWFRPPTGPVRPSFVPTRAANWDQTTWSKDLTALGWHPRVLQPRGPWQYTNPVYLLVGAGCFSATESFVAAMQLLPQVTTAGDTTGGASGNPREFPLVLAGQDTGWRYSVSQWMERTASGLVIEWNGIPPGVPVATEPGRDAVLEWALAR